MMIWQFFLFFYAFSLDASKHSEAPRGETRVESKQEDISDRGKAIDPLIKSSSERLSAQYKAMRSIESLRKVNSEKSVIPEKPTDISPQNVESKTVGGRQKNQTLDLKNGFKEDKAVPVSIMTPETVAAKQPVQRYEKGIAIRYNEKMTEPVHNYVDALKTEAKYKNVATYVPEIFTSYVLEFIETQRTIFRSYNSRELVKFVFSRWKAPLDKSADVANLYSGMNLLETINFSENYTQARLSNNRFMSVDMDLYVQALRSEYMHVPDIILETYVTKYLKDPANQKYEQKKVLTKVFGLVPIEKFIDNVDKPIPIKPEDIVNVTKGTFNSEKKVFSGLEMPIVDGRLISRDLKDFQKLYLTIQAIENINKRYPQEYRQEMSRDGLQIKQEQNFEHEKLIAINSPGNYEHFLLKFGIDKKDFNQLGNLSLSKDALYEKLKENYPSYREFIKNKEDQMAFEQLQIDFIRLNQDILKAEEVKKLQPQNTKLVQLLEDAKQFEGFMNEAILEKKIVDFFDKDKNDLKDNGTALPNFLEEQNRKINDTIKLIKENILSQISNNPKIINDEFITSYEDFIKDFKLVDDKPYVNELIKKGVLKELNIKNTSLKKTHSYIEDIDSRLEDLIAQKEDPKYLENLEKLLTDLEKKNKEEQYSSYQGEISQKITKVNELIAEQKKINYITTKFLNENSILWPDNIVNLFEPSNKDASLITEINKDIKNIKTELEKIHALTLEGIEKYIQDKGKILQPSLVDQVALEQANLFSVYLRDCATQASNIINKYDFKFEDKLKKFTIEFLCKEMIEKIYKEYPGDKIILNNQAKWENQIESIIKDIETKKNNNPELQKYRIWLDVFSSVDKKLLHIREENIEKMRFNENISFYVDNLLQNKSISSPIAFIKKKIQDIKENDAEFNLVKEKSELNRLSNVNFILEKQEDVLTVYQEILNNLEKRQKEELQKSAAYQFRKNLWDGLQNVWNNNFNQAGSQVVNAAGSIPAALGEANEALTQYVYSILGPIKDNLSPAALMAIATCIATVTPVLTQIQQTNASDEDKNKMQQEALKAMMTDIGNIVVADQTGASADIVAGKNVEAIAISGLFNKAIKSLVPDDPYAGYSYNAPVSHSGHLDNITQFQQKYNATLINQSLNQPLYFKY